MTHTPTTLHVLENIQRLIWAADGKGRKRFLFFFKPAYPDLSVARRIVADAIQAEFWRQNARVAPTRDGAEGTEVAWHAALAQCADYLVEHGIPAETASLVREFIPDPVPCAPPKPAPDALRSVSVSEYLRDYEFRGEGGDHAPTDNEKELIEDAIEGYLTMLAAPVPPADGAQARLIERCARIAEPWQGHWLDKNSTDADRAVVAVRTEIAKTIRGLSPSPAGAAEPVAWLAGERESVARAIFGDGWQCCANLGPYVQDAVNELNEQRELLKMMPEDLVEHQRDLLEQTKDTTHQPLAAPPVRRDREAVLRLLQASSCFRGQVCASLPCACADSLADLSLPVQPTARPDGEPGGTPHTESLP